MSTNKLNYNYSFTPEAMLTFQAFLVNWVHTSKLKVKPPVWVWGVNWDVDKLGPTSHDML
jgi:hypothetical protein